MGMKRIHFSWPGSRLLRLAFYLLLTLPALWPVAPVTAQTRGPVYEVALDGVISRYSVAYLRRALREAEAASAEALVVRVATQGAVLSDLRAVSAELAAAQVPVVIYLAPSGTQAGVAGVWLLSAAQLAAMAPDTSFGAATPLAEPSGNLSEATRELFRAEVIRQLSAWNSAQGRSTAWIEQAVREGAVLSNEQALALDPPAIDLVARDDAELLTLLEGRTVRLANDEQRTLRTLGRTAQPLAPTLWEALLLLLANPTVAFLLLIMAGMALYAELITPTVGVLAGLGLVLLVGAGAGLLALPVRGLAVLGVFIAFGLVAIDLYVPSHGAVTVVGLVVLVVSALTLFDSAQAPGVSVALWAVVLVALLLAAFAALGIYLVVRTRSTPVVTGQEGLVGRLAEVRKRLEPEGMVFVEGALWRAFSEEGDVERGEWVRVTGVYQLRLTVRRIAEEPAPL